MKEMPEKPLSVDQRPALVWAGGQTFPPIERKPASFDPKILQLLLDGNHVEIRNVVKQLMIQPEFRYYDGNDVAI